MESNPKFSNQLSECGVPKRLVVINKNFVPLTEIRLPTGLSGYIGFGDGVCSCEYMYLNSVEWGDC